MRSNDRGAAPRSEEHTSELQSHRDLHSFPTRRSSDLAPYLVTQSAMGHLLAPVSMLLPLALYALERSRRGSDAWLAFAGAALASIPLSGQVHLALGAVPFFVLYGVLRRPVRIAGVAGCALAGVFGALAVYVASIRGSVGAGGRSFDQVERYSADLLDLVARDPRHGLESAVFVGWLLPLVSVVGAVAVLLQGRYGLAAALLAGVAVPCILALGANLPGYRELPVYLPDRQEATVYLHYAMQAPRERPAGYSTTAPKQADATGRELRDDPCSARDLGVRYLAVFKPAKRPCSGVLIGEDGPVSIFRLRQVSESRDRRR